MASDIGFLAIACLALAMNLLLVAIALQIKHRPQEMLLAIALAAVDIFLSALTILAVGHHLVTGHTIDRIPHACNVKGALDFIGIFLSMLLVSLIALARTTRVVGCATPRWVRLGLLLFTLLFSGLVVACATQDTFGIPEEGIECAPVSSTSGLSRAVLALHGVALLLFLGITVACYVYVLVSITLSPECTELDFHALPDPACPPLTRRPVILRTTISTLAYIVCILPPAVFLFLAAASPRRHAERFNTHIDLFLTSISLLNPSLVLFAHSIIFQQLRATSRRLLLIY